MIALREKFVKCRFKFRKTDLKFYYHRIILTLRFFICKALCLNHLKKNSMIYCCHKNLLNILC